MRYASGMDQLSIFPATLILIAINVLVSIYGWLNQQFLLKNLFDVGAVREKREYHRLVTSGFLHGGVFHLLINMFVLWQFGGVLERELGATTFLIIYFGSLFAGNAWEYVDKRDQPDYRAVGASGATSGALLMFLKARALPRLGTSNNTRWFPLDKLVGRRMRTGKVLLSVWAILNPIILPRTRPGYLRI